MNKLNKWLIWALVILVAYYSFVYLSNIIFYIVLSIILSFICRPIKKRLSEKGIAGLKLPDSIAALISICAFGLVIFSLSLLFVPLLAKQIEFFSNIDFNSIAEEISQNTSSLVAKLKAMNMWPSEEDWAKIVNNAVSLLSAKQIEIYFGSIISLSTGVFITIFSVFFITLFLLKDANLLSQIILALTPDNYEEKVKNTMLNSKELLSRYFTGILIQTAVMSCVVWAGLSIVGVQNALVLGLITGFLNIIPYIGPLLSGIIGLVLSITSELAIGNDILLGSFSLKIIVVYLIAQLLDNIITQPIVFSKSVKAHPLEIFLIILIAGTLFGIIGMIAAIPVYTILRVVLREFFPELKIVQKMTNSLEKKKEK